jgi:hypothetical protein
VAPAEDPLGARPVTNDTNRGIRSYAWAYNNQLLYLQDRDGDELWRLFKVDPNQSKGEAERQLGIRPHSSVAGQPRICSIEYKLPGLDRLWQELHQRGES